MRCKQCEYRLWNLRSRTCPECGSPFSPSDFEFVPGSVRFCCPHCNQDYYGTDLKGHLVPAAFDCGSCGRSVHMDEMVLLPAEGVDEEETTTGLLPWPNRKRIGAIKAWFRMLGMGLVAPGKLGRAITPNASTGSAMWFALLTTFLLTGVGTAPILLIAFVPLMAGAPAGGGVGGPGVIGMIAGLSFGLVFGCGLVFVLMLLTGLVAHGVLRITGDTAGGLSRTYQAVFYSSGANALTGIPCLGFYVGWIWWVVSGSIVLKEAQRVHGGRAAMAVLTVPVGAVALILTFYASMIYMVVSSGWSTPTMGTGSGSTFVSRAIAAYREDQGDWPGHAIELLTRGYLAPGELVIIDPRCPLGAWTIGGATFNSLPDLPAAQLDKIEAKARAWLPDNVIAHRAGDWVFTYHGIDAATADGELWIAVGSPDPECSFVAGQLTLFEVVTLDGQVRRMRGDRSRWMVDQNKVRAAHGLAPLPDLSTITHTKPATSGP